MTDPRRLPRERHSESELWFFQECFWVWHVLRIQGDVLNVLSWLVHRPWRRPWWLSKELWSWQDLTVWPIETREPGCGNLYEAVLG